MISNYFMSLFIINEYTKILRFYSKAHIKIKRKRELKIETLAKNLLNVIKQLQDHKTYLMIRYVLQTFERNEF